MSANPFIPVQFEEKTLYVDVSSGNIFNLTQENGLQRVGRWYVQENVPVWCPYLSPLPQASWQAQQQLYNSVLIWKSMTEQSQEVPMEMDDDPMGEAVPLVQEPANQEPPAQTPATPVTPPIESSPVQRKISYYFGSDSDSDD